MNNYSLKSDIPKTVTIIRIKDEAEDFKTFFFNYDKKCYPGQFIMVWLPRIDEKPFTVSFISNDEIGITVQRRGNFTSRLFQLNIGDKIGVRGPFGHGFSSMKGRSCIIVGGSGAAAIKPLTNILSDPFVIIGARSRNQLLYVNEFANAIFTTDDGSFGFHGNVSDAFLSLINENHVDNVYTCGPEKMMKSIINICINNGISCQFALERYMKCGLGICGQCTCGKKRVCTDGPVFSLNDLDNLSEFGVSGRDKTGNIVLI